MDERILKLKEELESKIAEAADLVGLDSIRVGYLGKKGSITNLVKGMKDLAAEQRKTFGAHPVKLRLRLISPDNSRTKTVRKYIQINGLYRGGLLRGRDRL